MRFLRIASFFFSLLLVVGLLGCGDDTDSSRADAPKTNQDVQQNRVHEPDPYPVPDTTLQTIDGERLNLAEQDGRVLLVNFWATWCGPCREEIPDLIDLQEALGDDGLTVVGISLDKEGESVVRSFMSNYDFNYPVVVDSTGATEQGYGATHGLPTTFVVNADGDVVKRVLGIFPTDEMRPELESMLGGEGAENDAT
ncbi:MAG: TlpA disulfide reductase family protein [Salinibacter sp.]